MKELSDWQNFYVIVGSSAGALIGLQFVLISLIAHLVAGRSGSQAGSAFSTPTVVHFTVVLLLCAAGATPWRGTDSLAVVWCGFGLAGFAYEITVVRQVSRQSRYKPVLEDWLFHAVLPLVTYGSIAGAAFYGRSDLHAALFVIAGAVLLLLIIGIHNTWDAATYHLFTNKPDVARTGNEPS